MLVVNKIQKRIAITVLTVMALICLFPPWKFQTTVDGANRFTFRYGHRFIWCPPQKPLPGGWFSRDYPNINSIRFLYHSIDNMFPSFCRSVDPRDEAKEDATEQIQENELYGTADIDISLLATELMIVVLIGAAVFVFNSTVISFCCLILC